MEIRFHWFRSAGIRKSQSGQTIFLTEIRVILSPFRFSPFFLLVPPSFEAFFSIFFFYLFPLSLSLSLFSRKYLIVQRHDKSYPYFHPFTGGLNFLLEHRGVAVLPEISNPRPVDFKKRLSIDYYLQRRCVLAVEIPSRLLFLLREKLCVLSRISSFSFVTILSSFTFRRPFPGKRNSSEETRF